MPYTDIRFKYSLAGGALMDFGTYNVNCIRQIFGTEPEECLEATYRGVPPPGDREIDEAMKARWRFPGGGIGEIEADLTARGEKWKLPKLALPMTEVELPDKEVSPGTESGKMVALKEGEKHFVKRTLKIWNMTLSYVYHRIDVIDEHSIRSSSADNINNTITVKSWTEKTYQKAYTWPKTQENNKERKGEEWWTSYRYQLEAFVDRVKGRDGTGVWVDAEDSIRQMEMVDGCYERAGLPIRETRWDEEA
jgi:predicted dehydrogenase